MRAIFDPDEFPNYTELYGESEGEVSRKHGQNVHVKSQCELTSFCSLH